MKSFLLFLALIGLVITVDVLLGHLVPISKYILELFNLVPLHLDGKLLVLEATTRYVDLLAAHATCALRAQEHLELIKVDLPKFEARDCSGFLVVVFLSDNIDHRYRSFDKLLPLFFSDQLRLIHEGHHMAVEKVV